MRPRKIYVSAYLLSIKELIAASTFAMVSNLEGANCEFNTTFAFSDAPAYNIFLLPFVT